VAAAVRPFGLRDVPLVQTSQRAGAPLDLESAVIDPIHPLSAALRNYVHRAVGRQWRMTYVLRGQRDGHRLSGFIQVSVRPTRPEVDVVFLAPSLGSRVGATAPEVWERLLAYACQRAGAHGRQRVFAKLPAGDSDAIEVFRHVGFTVYAQEHIFRLDHPPASLPPVELTLRPYTRRDDWGIQRLFCHAAPRLVQQVECLPGQGWDLPGVAHRRRAQRFVWESANEVRGFASVRRGVHGHWLKLLIDHDDTQFADDFITSALAHIGPTLRPVYCGVRGYEPGLQHALQRRGFRLQASHLLLVKPTIVPVREPVLNWSIVPERGVEAAPTTSQIHSLSER
jgi:hypothetical protein